MGSFTKRSKMKRRMAMRAAKMGGKGLLAGGKLIGRIAWRAGRLTARSQGRRTPGRVASRAWMLSRGARMASRAVPIASRAVPVASRGVRVVSVASLARARASTASRMALKRKRPWWRRGRRSAAIRAQAAVPRAASALAGIQEMRKPPRKSRPAMFASAGVGAVAMYLLDPHQGKRRRHIARDKALKLARRGARKAVRRARYAEGVAEGRRYRAAAVPGSQQADLDDVTLAHKVESEVFRDKAIEKGKINVNSEGGVVYLRGELASDEEIQRVLDHTRAVAGVREVKSMLHVHGAQVPTREQATSITPNGGSQDRDDAG